MLYSILIKVKFIYSIVKWEIKDFIIVHQIKFFNKVYFWDLNKLKFIFKIKNKIFYFRKRSIQKFIIFCLLNLLLLIITFIYSILSVVLTFFIVDFSKFLILKEFYYNFLRGDFFYFIKDIKLYIWFLI